MEFSHSIGFFGFNSTMVRLKDDAEIADTRYFMTFQFHNGSIKRNHELQQVSKSKQFQFHNGSIKSDPDNVSFKRGINGFQFHNGSIKSNGKGILLNHRDMFQFHNGSIKRWTASRLFSTQAGFNSTMVRLKGRCNHNVGNRRNVSIPQWFD